MVSVIGTAIFRSDISIFKLPLDIAFDLDFLKQDHRNIVNLTGAFYIFYTKVSVLYSSVKEKKLHSLLS